MPKRFISTNFKIIFYINNLLPPNAMSQFFQFKFPRRLDRHEGQRKLAALNSLFVLFFLHNATPFTDQLHSTKLPQISVEWVFQFLQVRVLSLELEPVVWVTSAGSIGIL